jgi:MYXO-CTERM domain-containing protein
VSGSVSTGESYTFEITMKAPDETGTYVESFGLVQEAVTWFAEQGGPADNVITLDLQVIDGVANGSGGGTAEGGAGTGGGSEGGAPADDDGDGATDECDCRAAPGTSSHASGGLLLAGLALAFAAARRRCVVR